MGQVESDKSKGSGFRIVSCMLAALLLSAIISGCSGHRRPVKSCKRPAGRELPAMGYSVQVGAFANPANAARFSESLREEGVDAFHFRHSSGLYKVRFGNFSTEQEAGEKAEIFRSAGILEDYYIVKPGDYASARRSELGEEYVRKELVKSALSFVGIPYLWGGSSRETGFDCSGLTLTVYRLNGFYLPRSSEEQYGAGEPVEMNRLRHGDLVFFKIAEHGKISHVGIFIGNGKFIHAPGTGKSIRVESLKKSYFAGKYAGARKYI
ncbi:MAG: NlpC/P60 family protein [Syntrophales bacterium]|nr:NlpC/P60 family protein [Syntrophales bacterium]